MNRPTKFLVYTKLQFYMVSNKPLARRVWIQDVFDKKIIKNMINLGVNYPKIWLLVEQLEKTVEKTWVRPLVFLDFSAYFCFNFSPFQKVTWQLFSAKCIFAWTKSVDYNMLISEAALKRSTREISNKLQLKSGILVRRPLKW